MPHEPAQAHSQSHARHLFLEEKLMTRTRSTGLAASAVAAGIAALALAAPAQAMLVHEPPAGPRGTVTHRHVPAGTQQSTSWRLDQLAAGATGGIVIAGAGFAAVAAVRRRPPRAGNAA